MLVFLLSIIFFPSMAFGDFIMAAFREIGGLAVTCEGLFELPAKGKGKLGLALGDTTF